MKKTTRKQKRQQNPAGPKGKSKYALKLTKRQRLAAKLGLSDMPLPILNIQEAE